MTMDTRADSITIALMGATGSGKSTFANLVSKANLGVGSSLESCTSEVQVAPPFLLDGKIVTLIDTPGFDDTVKTEAEILKLIAEFLALTYESGRRLNGVIFLHRISDRRMGGVATKNFRLFRKICGDDALKNVVIVTNMWGDVNPADGESRERELLENDRFFKPAIQKGARLIRHDNSLESARNILRHILGFPPEALSIQREVVDEHKSIAQTAAGRDLQAELDMLIKQHREELKGIKEEMEELMASKDKKHDEEIQELRDALKEVRTQLKQVESREQVLRDDLAVNQREKDEQLKKMSQVMEKREMQLRSLNELTREQKAKVGELEETLVDVRQKAKDQEIQTQKVNEALKGQETAHQVELERLRNELKTRVAAEKKAEIPQVHPPQQPRRIGLFEAINMVYTPPPPPPRRLGFFEAIGLALSNPQLFAHKS